MYETSNKVFSASVTGYNTDFKTNWLKKENVLLQTEIVSLWVNISTLFQQD